MGTREPAADMSAGDPSVSWRDQAVARSLDSARARAEKRVQRFLDAAVELMDEAGPGKDFTVQDVVERSGQSLRSFYQYFGGKHELLLTMFEESVRSTAEYLRDELGAIDDPLERVHRFVVDYYRLCRPANRSGGAKRRSASPAPPSPTMVDFAQQLLTGHPTEAARAFDPIVSLFGEVLDQAAEAGVLRDDLRRSAVAGIVLEAIMFNAFSTTLGGAPSAGGDVGAAEELWDLVFRGIGA